MNYTGIVSTFSSSSLPEVVGIDSIFPVCEIIKLYRLIDVN